MISNVVIALILRFSPNSIALQADYVTVVEDRPWVEFFEFSPCHNTRGHKYKLFKHQTTACVRSYFFSVNVLSTSGTPRLMMSVSTLFICLDSITRINLSSHLIGIVLGLVDSHFLLSVSCVLLILSRLIRETISVYFSYLVVLFHCHFIWFY